jgi:hypothetical protein
MLPGIVYFMPAPVAKASVVLFSSRSSRLNQKPLTKQGQANAIWFFEDYDL